MTYGYHTGLLKRKISLDWSDVNPLRQRHLAIYYLHHTDLIYSTRRAHIHGAYGIYSFSVIVHIKVKVTQHAA